MTKILSFSAIIAGACLIYLGYQRQQSVEGKVDSSLASMGQKVDGSDHMTLQTKYYIAGTVLLVGGAVGVGVIRK